MMARHFVSGFSHSRQAHSGDYGRGARAERRRKMTARARVGPQGRLMDNLGLTQTGDDIDRQRDDHDIEEKGDQAV
jgi:hypothetical protein